ncbi:hypothetical protein ACHAW6_010813, partial [Cyclotella cf. meneghiniana]
MMMNDDELISMTNSLSIKLKSAALSTDNATVRRDCTRLLNQWKAVLRQLSKEDCYHVISNSVTVGDAGDTNRPVTFIDDSIVSILFCIIENEKEFSTEGHRETSVEILKSLISRAFCTVCRSSDLLNGDGSATCHLACRTQKQTDVLIRVLTSFFRQCSVTFHKRMQRNSQGNANFHFSDKGTMMEPMESSEHIRLLLVELMLDASTYLTEITKECTVDEKALFHAVSVACQTLAKSALPDTYPEVQRASCSLIQTLARLCPIAVRMNATSLLLPLTGIRPSDPYGDQTTECFPVRKSSLFWHRHTKTRSKAVNASSAIVLCCPSESIIHNNDCSSNNLLYVDCNQGQHTLTRHGQGSKSSSIEQVLHDIVLCGWEELIRLDPSVAVRISVLESLGQVACKLNWTTFLSSNTVDPSLHDEDSDPDFKSPMSLEFLVQTKVLSLFLFGLSDAHKEVRAIALRTMSSFCKEGNSYPWPIFASYYQPLLELALDQCSSPLSLVQSRVRSLEALQILFSLTILLTMDSGAEGTSSDIESKLTLSQRNIRYTIEVLSNAILSEEKDVLDASLKCCRTLGSSDKLAIKILSVMPEVNHKDVFRRDKDELESTPDTAAATFFSTPRRMVSTLLLLDGLMNGYLSNHEMSPVLHDIDSLVPASATTWFYNTHSVSIICRTLSCNLVVSGAMAHFSLAWALLDACTTFVRCALKPSEGKQIEFELTTECIADILTSITYLLGCPDEYGISSNAVRVLDELSRSRYCVISTESNSFSRLALLDDYFRQVCMKINATAPFPWKRSDPTFLAIDAFLRINRGSTIQNNFDLIAPVFLYHLPEKKGTSDTSHADGLDSRTFAVTEVLAEEYSIRISLMSLLQAVLSDGTFLKSSSTQHGNSTLTNTSSQFSAQYTFDILLSLVVPNLVWKSGALAAALRKLSVATLFALLSHLDHPQELQNGPMPSVNLPSIEQDTYTYVLPILHSNLDDTESTTRELSCACLLLIFRHMTREIFQDLWNTHTRVLETMYPRLVALLDDSHNPVRLAACTTLERYLTLAFDSTNQSNANCCIGLSALENIAESLMLTMDDPDSNVQDQALQVLCVLVNYGMKRDKKVADIIERLAANGLKSHRDTSYCQLLLQQLHTALQN